MNGPFYIETLARNGDVLHRHQVPGLPIRIGRGYDNDYIVDDAFTAPNHVVIEADDAGGLVMRDLGTRNGVVHQGKRHAQLPVDGNTVVRIGHTSLRVRSPQHAVEPELLDRTMHRWEGALPGMLGILLITIFTLFTLWLNDTEEFQPIRYLQAAAMGIAGGLTWAGIWAVGNRLFDRHARLGRHLFILGSALAAATVFKIVSTVTAYALSWDEVVRYGSHVAIAIGCVMIYFHLRTIKPHHPRKFAILSGSLFVLGSGLTLLSNQQVSGQLADEHYMSVVLPPALRASEDYPVDAFMADVAALKPELDVERTEKVRDAFGDDEEEE
ncbi:MAG TPA: FHA domain-containing protein [Telluria sp.]|nr:FHA domain-containing protein [Telluria sp.]